MLRKPIRIPKIKLPENPIILAVITRDRNLPLVAAIEFTNRLFYRRPVKKYALSFPSKSRDDVDRPGNQRSPLIYVNAITRAGTHVVHGSILIAPLPTTKYGDLAFRDDHIVRLGIAAHAKLGPDRLHRRGTALNPERPIGIVRDLIGGFVRAPAHDGHDSGTMADSIPVAWRTVLRRHAGQFGLLSGMVSGMPGMLSA
jgi:hypothetical protein